MFFGGFMRLLTAILGLTVLASPAIAQTKAASAQGAVQLGAYSTAIDTIGEPGTPEESYWFGRAQIGLQMYDDAEATFTGMLQADQTNSMAHDGLAHLYNARKQYAEALASAN